jgi:hypothetical protein
MGAYPEQEKRTYRSSANEKWVNPKKWITCCNGEFIREDSVMWISEEYNGVVLIGTTDGNTYNAPPVEVSLMKGFIVVPMYDNGITTYALESETEESEAECGSVDSEQTEELQSDSDPVVPLSDELLKVYFRANYILAVYMQCADADEDGDYSYAIVLQDGRVRDVFCHLPLEEMYHQIEFDANQNPQFFRPTPVQYENRLLDRGDPRYVVCFRPEGVTCYSNIKKVSENEAFVDVMLNNGHNITNVWVNGDSWMHLYDIIKSSESA